MLELLIYTSCWTPYIDALLQLLMQAKTMGMKAGPASQLVVETLGLEGQMTGQQFLTDREVILHKTFSSAALMPGKSCRPTNGSFCIIKAFFLQLYCSFVEVLHNSCL